MTEITTIRSEPTFRPPERARPSPEREQRFEDALARSKGDEREGEFLAAAPQDKTPGEPQASALPHGHAGQHYRDDTDQRHASRGLEDGLLPTGAASTPAPAEARASAAPEAAPPPASTATLSASYMDVALRLALPSGFQGAETSLTITDPRSIAAQAVLSQDAAGTLSLDIATQQDGSSEQQREELRARLEARGHRVGRIDWQASR